MKRQTKSASSKPTSKKDWLKKEQQLKKFSKRVRNHGAWKVADCIDLILAGKRWRNHYV